MYSKMHTVLTDSLWQWWENVTVVRMVHSGLLKKMTLSSAAFTRNVSSFISLSRCKSGGYPAPLPHWRLLLSTRPYLSLIILNTASGRMITSRPCVLGRRGSLTLCPIKFIVCLLDKVTGSTIEVAGECYKKNGRFIYCQPDWLSKRNTTNTSLRLTGDGVVAGWAVVTGGGAVEPVNDSYT